MARPNEIQYVRFYSYGSAAQQVQTPVPEKKVRLPKPVKEQKAPAVIQLDALALTGLVVTAVMLVCMLVGLIQVNYANARLQQAQSVVAQLEAERDRLKTEYDHGYDLAEIRVSAEAMGLVPEDQVRHVTVQVPEAVVEQPPLSRWEQWLQALKGLFA